MSYSVSIFDFVIQKARHEGYFDSGIVKMGANTIELRGNPKVMFMLSLLLLHIWTMERNFVLNSLLLQVVHEDPMSGASTLLFTFILDRGTTWKVFSFSLYGVCIFNLMTT